MTLKSTDNPPICFPENLFTDQDITSPEKRWWVARTKSRQEKALAWSLKNMGISYFLPLVPRPQKCKKRVRTSIVPLFNGYLFFYGDHLARHQTLSCGKTAQVIEVDGQETLTSELSHLSHITEEETNMQLCDFLSKGKRVRIIAGPFAGVEGIVKKRQNKTRLILQVEAIQQAVAIEVSLDHVLPL